MAIFLGLGANQGDRAGQISQAIARLQVAGFRIETVSPVVESPALLPFDAKPSWNQPYLNCVVKGQADWEPLIGLGIIKRIEEEIGRRPSERWAPRPIDVDILIWHDLEFHSPDLTIPHIGIKDRSFVLSPLNYLAPNLVVPGLNQRVFELSRNVPLIPLWMGILNVTPDSFSDGGQWLEMDSFSEHVDEMVNQHVQILDIGGESTPPICKEYT